MSGQSDFLFAQPSLLEGAARILDFGDLLTQYNRSLTPEQADAIATTLDWQAVYGDLWAAVEQYRQSLEADPQKESFAAGAVD